MVKVYDIALKKGSFVCMMSFCGENVDDLDTFFGLPVQDRIFK